MWKNREFKVGQEIDSTYGIGKVTAIVSDDDFPVKAEGVNWSESFTYSGLFDKKHAYPSIFHRDNNPFEMAGKWQERNNLTLLNEVNKVTDDTN
jgi:hypothetical protein